MMNVDLRRLIAYFAPLSGFIKKNCCLLIAVFYTGLGMYLRFKRLAGRELWTDELWQIAQTVGHFKPVWRRMIVTDFTSFPGAYLVNYPFVRFFGIDKWAVNIPNYFITFLGFYFLYLICRRHLKSFWGYLIAFHILCFNAHLIFHSFEFRPYSVLPTLSLAAFYFAEVVVCRWQQLAVSRKICLGLFFIFAIIYHVFGIMIAGLCLLYFFILEAKKRPYKAVLKGMRSFLWAVGLPGFLLFLWYTSGTKWQEVQQGNWYPFDYYPNPFKDFVHFIRQVSFNLMAHKNYGQKHLALGIWIAFLLPQRERFRQMGFFFLFILLPVMLILTLAIIEKYWFLDRQLVWIMPLYAFFLGWCWDTIIIYLSGRFRRPVRAGAQSE